MNFETIGKIHDKKVLAKAAKILEDLSNGLDVFIKTLRVRAKKQIGNELYKAITVNYNYRLLLKNGIWFLMTHERYNKEIWK